MVLYRKKCWLLPLLYNPVAPHVVINNDDAMDMRPCAFNDIGERIVADDLISSEYDSEVEDGE